ncbi:acyl-coenzyme A synthetase ACSM4, mitochondrial-like [Orbicella faveolata]|uniref:acyl-coenzyme A synthetase ACSM4, mitochondrial-like n=1 Tax=Orbicella faveolata TaxID=48498 RepID=UPI0009E4EB00|nr:acyl-coenzyme A synthetase ACSM4, mitochondrial-like [Orbicella faveolata]
MEALHERNLRSFSFPNLKRCFVAGEPTNERMVRRWKEETGVKIWNYYGQTEMNILTLPREPGDDSRPASVGKPLPGIEMLIVDDNGKEVPPGTLGRVVIGSKPCRPVGMFTCYVVRRRNKKNILTLPREPGDDSRPASVGKPLPGIEMLIVDDNGKEVPPGTLGRVVIGSKPCRPVGMFTCYVDEPEKTAACYSGDFYVTGDLGRMDAEGYFWVVGRSDDMIIYNAARRKLNPPSKARTSNKLNPCMALGRNGTQVTLVEGERSLHCAIPAVYIININPCEVENCLKGHPAVLDCAVVSSPYMMTQTTKAFIVLSSGFKERNQDELIKELQDHVTYNTGAWMCPKKMEFIEDLPKTAVGKVSRRELRNREWSIE